LQRQVTYCCCVRLDKGLDYLRKAILLRSHSILNETAFTEKTKRNNPVCSVCELRWQPEKQHIFPKWGVVGVSTPERSCRRILIAHCCDVAKARWSRTNASQFCIICPLSISEAFQLIRERLGFVRQPKHNDVGSIWRDGRGDTVLCTTAFSPAPSWR
jgi:hypothetical protein